MDMKNMSKIAVVVLLLLFLVGCAGVPVREEVKVNMKAPVGTIEGNQFTGIRFPFNVSAPPNWQISTKYPKFMIDQGYHKEGLDESEVFIFNPTTQSNLQIDFTPAGRYSTFDQQKMENLVNSVTGEFKDEVKDHYGKDVKSEEKPTEAVKLKGVAYAALKSGTFEAKGQKYEQGWLYAFNEPYQIFILYTVVGKDLTGDRQAIKAILDSFEVVAGK